jgi:hypothetical protein
VKSAESNQVFLRELEEQGLTVFARLDLVRAAFRELTGGSASADSKYNLAVGMKDVLKWVAMFLDPGKLVNVRRYIKTTSATLGVEKKKNRNSKAAAKASAWTKLGQYGTAFINETMDKCKKYIIHNLKNKVLTQEQVDRKFWRISGAMFFLLMMPGETVLRTSNVLQVSPLHNLSVDPHTLCGTVSFEKFKGKKDWPSSWPNPSFVLPPSVVVCLYYYVKAFRSRIKIGKAAKGRGALFFNPTGTAIKKLHIKQWQKMMARFFDASELNAHQFRHIYTTLHEEAKRTCKEMADIARAHLHTRRIQVDYYILCTPREVQHWDYPGNFENGKQLNVQLRGEQYLKIASLREDELKEYKALITHRGALHDMLFDQDESKGDALDVQESDEETRWTCQAKGKGAGTPRTPASVRGRSPSGNPKLPRPLPEIRERSVTPPLSSPRECEPFSLEEDLPHDTEPHCIEEDMPQNSDDFHLSDCEQTLAQLQESLKEFEDGEPQEDGVSVDTLPKEPSAGEPKVYEVEKVLDMTIPARGKHNNFLVKFVGYTEPEWMPWYALCETARGKKWFCNMNQALLDYVEEYPMKCLVGPFEQAMLRALMNVQRISPVLYAVLSLRQKKH